MLARNTAATCILGVRTHVFRGDGENMAMPTYVQRIMLCGKMRRKPSFGTMVEYIAGGKAL